MPPAGKDLVALPTIRARSDRPTGMVEDDSRGGERAGEGGELIQL